MPVHFLAWRRFTKFGCRFRDRRPDGSGHDFRRRACSIPVSTPLQRGLRFLHPPLPRCRIRSPRGFPARERAQRRAYRVPQGQHDGDRCGLFAGGHRDSARPYIRNGTDHAPFWSKRGSYLRLLAVTTFINHSLLFTLSASLAPCPRRSSQTPPVSSRSPGLVRGGTLSGRFTQRRYQRCTARRLRLAAQPVSLPARRTGRDNCPSGFSTRLRC